MKMSILEAESYRTKDGQRLTGLRKTVQKCNYFRIMLF